MAFRVLVCFMSESKEHSSDLGKRFGVTIERILPRGLGLCHWNGKTVLVPLAAAGDHLIVEAVAEKGDVLTAEIREITVPSPDRIKPACGYYGICGGCDFQHLSYRAQLSAKVEMIRDCLRRIGKIDYGGEIEVIPSPLEFGYRTRAQFHGQKDSGKIGFYRRNSREVVEIEHCPILSPELNAGLANLRASSIFSAAREIDLVAGDSGDVSIYMQRDTPSEVETNLAGFRFRYSAKVFFQVNRVLTPELMSVATEGVSGRFALDLYAGVGLFSLPMSGVFETVLAVEEHPAACHYAVVNAELNKRRNIRVVNERVGSFLKNGLDRRPDFILLDPPRAGTERDTAMNVIALRAPAVSFVACEPSVLARDLRRFVESGYKIDRITALDMFPQTHHVETVARLTLN